MKLGPNQQAFCDALRTTTETQGRENLENRDGSYCALGILCLLYEAMTGGHLTRPDSGRLSYTTLIPYDQVIKWIGFHPADSGRSISIMNDMEKTFEYIADNIESRPEYFFRKSA